LVPCLLVLLVIAACGDRGDSAATPTSTPPGDSIVRTYRYEVAATAEGVLGGADAAPLEIHVTGEVAAADRQHAASRMTLGASTIALERIRVGDRVWTRDSEGPWIEDRVGTTGGSAGIDLDGAALTGADARARLDRVLDGLTAEADTLDGAPMHRYRLAADRLRLLLGVPADQPQTTLGRIEGDSTLWVTREERWPARLMATATPASGGTVRLDVRIRDHNAAIEVQPPA